MSFDGEFRLKAYGVVVRVRSNTFDLLAAARKELEFAFAGKAEIIDNQKVPFRHSYSLILDRRGRLVLFLNGKRLTSGDSTEKLLRYFNSLVRITVAEHAESRVFVHAGVVGWSGKTLILPARSFQGKSSLVAELVRQGADYFSDEYAVIDQNGLVHPFPRAITMRVREGEMTIRELDPKRLGGIIPAAPAPIGYVLLTEYRPLARWKPVRLSLGNGIMAVIPHTIPFQRDPRFSLKVLNTALNRAIIVKSPRGDAKRFSRMILDFFDNCN